MDSTILALLRGGAAVVVAFAFFVIAQWIALRALKHVMMPILSRATRDDPTSVTRLSTLERLARKAITYVLAFVTIVMLLGHLGLDVTTLLAGAGVFGLALSFGAQRLVRDVLTGFFLLVEDQFRLGEVVTLLPAGGLPQMTGTIADMGLRCTQLHDVTGKLVSIGNGDIGAVVNHSRSLTASVELGVPPGAALDKVREALQSLQLPGSVFAGLATIHAVTAVDATRTVLRVSAPVRPGRAPEGEPLLREVVSGALRAASLLA